jgi:predicted TIM-barrel fold metal-dependent hydrolase
VAKRWTGISKPLKDVMPLYQDYLDDFYCDKLVKRMDDSGIDVTAINVVDDLDKGMSDEQILQINKDCSEAAKQHPRRLLALAGIDPRRKDAPDLIRQCIKDYGMKGLKWHPDFGFYPNSKKAYKMLKVVNELDVPLLTHCGPWRRVKYSHPMHLDDVALDFPDLKIIAAHIGDMFWRDWVAIAKHRPNLFGDLSMWQFIATGQPVLFRRYLREIIDLLGSNRLLFGTDGPAFEPQISNTQWIELIKDLPVDNEDGIIFDKREVDEILGGNAERIFKLD